MNKRIFIWIKDNSPAFNIFFFQWIKEISPAMYENGMHDFSCKMHILLQIPAIIEWIVSKDLLNVMYDLCLQ